MNKDEYKRQNEKRDAAREDKFKWKWRPAWWKVPSDRFALFVVLFTLALVVVGSLQWQLMRSQLGELRRQLDDSEILEAASVTIKNLRVSGFPERPVADFDVVNSGRTRADAINILSSFDWTLATGKAVTIPRDPYGDEGWAVSDFGFSLEPTDPPKHLSMYAISIPPIREITRKYKSNPPEQEDEPKLPSGDDFLSGRFYAFVYVVGTYKDIFGKPHHVSDCVTYSGTGFQSCFSSNRRY
jgi:hypothetical protein